MKKLLIYTLTVIMLIMCLPLSTSTKLTSNYSSINIPPEEIELVQDTPDDIVYKIYYASIKYFTLKNSIYTIIERCENTSTGSVRYAVKNVDTQLYTIKSVVDGKPQIGMVYDYSNDVFIKFIELAFSPDKIFDPSVTVHNIYFIDARGVFEGIYVYYVTDHGDFVLCKEALYSSLPELHKEVYLFPAADFYEYAGGLDIDYDPFAAGDHIIVDLSIFDGTEYEIHPFQDESNASESTPSDVTEPTIPDESDSDTAPETEASTPSRSDPTVPTSSSVDSSIEASENGQQAGNNKTNTLDGFTLTCIIVAAALLIAALTAYIIIRAKKK